MDRRADFLESLSLCIKRRPYIKYKNYPETVEKVVQLLKLYDKGYVAIICEKTGFKERIVYKLLEKLNK